MSSVIVGWSQVLQNFVFCVDVTEHDIIMEQIDIDPKF